jgi:hypothetical protein
MGNDYRQLENGTYVPSIPEPFWLGGGILSLFRWKPGCYSCRIKFKNMKEYEEHWIKYHSEDNK